MPQEEGVWKEGRKAELGGSGLDTGVHLSFLCYPSSPPPAVAISREVKSESSQGAPGEGRDQAG